MALTRVEVYLKCLESVARHKKPENRAKKFKIDCLEDAISDYQNHQFTKEDLKILQEELDKLKKDFVYPSPESLKFYLAILDAFVKETNDEYKERYKEYLTDVIKETERYGSEGIKKIKKILDEAERENHNH